MSTFQRSSLVYVLSGLGGGKTTDHIFLAADVEFRRQRGSDQAGHAVTTLPVSAPPDTTPATSSICGRHAQGAPIFLCLPYLALLLVRSLSLSVLVCSCWDVLCLNVRVGGTVGQGGGDRAGRTGDGYGRAWRPHFSPDEGRVLH